MSYKIELQNNNIDLGSILESIRNLPQAGSGGGSGSIGGLNIHYGDEAPTDTSKLWVKCAEPSNVVISSEIGQLPMTFDGISSVPLAGLTRCVKVGDFVYGFGTSSTDVLKYNLRTHEYVILTGIMPSTTLGNGGFAPIGTDIYVIGGGTSDKSIYRFDTVTDTFILVHADVLNRVSGRVIGVVGNVIYAIGGMGSNGYSGKKIYRFDTTTGVVTTLANDFPTTICGAPAVTFGTKLYIFGGYYRDGTLSSKYGPLSGIYVLDAETNNVTKLTTTMTSLGYVGAGLVGTKVYLFGGENLANKVNSVYVFDIETKSIETLDAVLPIADKNKRVIVDGMDIFIFGGSTDTSLYRVPLQTDVPAETLHIIPSIDKNIFPIFEGDSDVEMGVSMILLGNSEGHGEVVPAYLHRDGEWVEIQQNGGYTHKCKEPVLQEKTVTENGEVVADAGYDGLSKVIVDVKNSGGVKTYKAKEIKASTCSKYQKDATDKAMSKYCTVQGSNDWVYRTFLQYDLSGIPDNAEIVSAIMHFRCNSHNDNAATGTTNIARVTSEWDEYTCCWNNMPSWTGKYLSGNIQPPNVGAWGMWCITSLVKEWVSGQYPNYGLHIVNNNEGGYRCDWNFNNHFYDDTNVDDGDDSNNLGTYIEIVYKV